MKIELNYQTDVLCLPGAVLQKLDTASDADLRVLLCLASDEALRGDFDAAKLSSRLDLSEKEIEMSVAFWRGAGLIKASRGAKKQAPQQDTEHTPKPRLLTGDSLPSYTGKELEALMKERADLARLLNECQKLLGKVFNCSESNKMIALVDYLHLPEDYILLLCSYCVSRDKGSVAYVCATAQGLWNDDIVSSEGLEEYIDREEKRHTFENFLRTLFGLGQRKLTAKEKRFFDSWMQLGLPEEIISGAYERSVDSTGELSLPHLNKILVSYKEAGVKTLEDAAKQDERHREEMKKKFAPGTGGKPSPAEKEQFPGFDIDEFYAIAEKKSREEARLLQKKKDQD